MSRKASSSAEVLPVSISDLACLGIGAGFLWRDWVLCACIEPCQITNTKRTVQRGFDKGEKSEFVATYTKALGETRTMLRALLLERAHSSDTALIFALKNYCQMRDRPEMATPAKDEVKEIRVSMGGKTVSQPKWMTC